MEYKEAVKILMRLLKKPKLTAKEKEALLIAIGVLDLVSLAKNSIKRIIKAKKAKRERDIEW